VRLLIEHKTSVSLAQKYGQTALHLASSYGRLDIVRLLIQHNTPVNLANKDGWTALHVASRNGHLDITQLLIEHGASATLGKTVSGPPDHTVDSASE
jgi:ankyrin repeat protein